MRTIIRYRYSNTQLSRIFIFSTNSDTGSKLSADADILNPPLEGKTLNERLEAIDIDYEFFVSEFSIIDDINSYLISAEEPELTDEERTYYSLRWAK